MEKVFTKAMGVLIMGNFRNEKAAADMDDKLIFENERLDWTIINNDITIFPIMKLKINFSKLGE
tara:strand:- start:42 stop:233 length:192 start_codon:yes stop_codon:yes gene_type:complete